MGWKLTSTMGATDVTETLDEALAITGVDPIQVKHRPRLLSDNGSAYVSGELQDYLDERGMIHTRGAPDHPQTQGKIERYHRSMKNVVKLEHYYYPWELEAANRNFAAYYNNERYHESLDNVTPSDVYFGRQYEIVTERDRIKKRTMRKRKKEYLAAKAVFGPEHFDDVHAAIRPCDGASGFGLPGHRDPAHRVRSLDHGDCNPLRTTMRRAGRIYREFWISNRLLVRLRHFQVQRLHMAEEGCPSLSKNSYRRIQQGTAESRNSDEVATIRDYSRLVR